MSSPIGYPQGDSLKAASSGSGPDNQVGQNLIDQAGGYSPVAAQTNPLTGGTKVSSAGDGVPTGQISEYYRAFVPGDQGAGNALDLTWNGADIVPAGTLTAGDMWATDGQITLPGGTGKFATIAGALASVDIVTTSLICSFWLKKATPGAAHFIFGQALPASWLFFQLSNLGSGQMVAYARGGNNEETQTLATIAGVANGAWRHFVYAVDHASKTYWIIIDKKIAATGTLTLTKSTANTKTLPFGVTHPSSGAEATAASTCYDIAHKDFHLLTPPSVSGLSLQRIVRKLYAAPGVALTDGDLA